MKQWIVVILIGVCMITQSFLGFSRSPLYPTFDAPTGIMLPRNLRTTYQLPYVRQKGLNIQGLNSLKASGSGQFSEQTFKEMIKQLPTDPTHLVVLDLRQESHGLVNGTPISWTDGVYNNGNLNKTKSEIEADEQQRLQLAARSGRILIDPMEGPARLEVKSAKTERELVEEAGCQYIRLPVIDHTRPSDLTIDQFVDIVNHLPNNRWIHFHCRAGKGRTTTFLTLLDIMKNAQHVSLEDILARQQLIGGIDLNANESKKRERKQAAEERLEFIKNFYTYCREVPDFHVSWSQWLDQQSSIAANPKASSSHDQMLCR